MNDLLERKILGEILLCDNKEKQFDYLLELGDADFTSNETQKIFKAYCDIVQRQKIEPFDVYQKLGNDLNISHEFIVSLTDNIVSVSEIKKHISQLKFLSHKRQLQRILNSSLGKISSATFQDEVEDHKNELITELSGSVLDTKTRTLNFQELRAKLFENLERKSNFEGYSFGLSDLDILLNGIESPRLYVIGGLKKSGKTRFVIHTLSQLFEQKIKAGFLSLEMPAMEITKLLYSRFSHIEDTKLRSNNFLTDAEKQTLKNVHYDNDNFLIECNSNLNIGQVIGRIRHLARLGCKVIFIDYLQRINHDHKNQVNELENICLRIADSSRMNEVAIVLLSQLSNLAEREIPTIGHLKGSGGIGESADSILLFDNIYRRTKEESKRNVIDIYIEQRYGNSGRVSIFADLGMCMFKDFHNAPNSILTNQLVKKSKSIYQNTQI